jgi:hypothetical protein
MNREIITVTCGGDPAPRFAPVGEIVLFFAMTMPFLRPDAPEVAVIQILGDLEAFNAEEIVIRMNGEPFFNFTLGQQQAFGYTPEDGVRYEIKLLTWAFQRGATRCDFEVSWPAPQR